MSNLLKQYFQDATDYLGDGSAQVEARNRERILDFCAKYQLDEEFPALVAQDDSWRTLATNTAVKYLVDVIPKKSLVNYPKGFQLPKITLRILDVLDPVPVIKIMTSDPLF